MLPGPGRSRYEHCAIVGLNDAEEEREGDTPMVGNSKEEENV